MALSLVCNVNALSAASPSFADRVIEHRLANGLTVLMVERHQTPVVSINITFAVGGINEQVGQTGIAHLYEHMAFKGTRVVGTTDYDKEKPILAELAVVGTELDLQEREAAAKGEGRRRTNERQSNRCRSGFWPCKHRPVSMWSAMKWHCCTSVTVGWDSMPQQGKI